LLKYRGNVLDNNYLLSFRGIDYVNGTGLAHPEIELKMNLRLDGMVRRMKVKFVLTMDDLVVNEKNFDQVSLHWESEMEQSDILELSHQWITSKNFLTQRMVGLTQVGESSLTIEPLDEVENV